MTTEDTVKEACRFTPGCTDDPSVMGICEQHADFVRQVHRAMAWPRLTTRSYEGDDQTICRRCGREITGDNVKTKPAPSDPDRQIETCRYCHNEARRLSAARDADASRKGQPWTVEELRVVKDSTGTVRQIAAQLGRTMTAVREARHKINRAQKPWPPADCYHGAMKQLFPNLPPEPRNPTTTELRLGTFYQNQEAERAQWLADHPGAKTHG